MDRAAVTIVLENAAFLIAQKYPRYSGAPFIDFPI